MNTAARDRPTCMITASTSFGSRATHSTAKAPAITALTAATIHQFAVPVVRETPQLAAEPASVAAMW